MGSPTTGIVIAAGFDRSDGPTPGIARIPIAGRPLVDLVIDALGESCDEIVVVESGPIASAGLGTARSVAVRTIQADDPAPGSRAPLLAGLAAASHPVALVATAAMPWLRPALLAALLSTLGGDARPAAAPILYGILRPYPCALRVDPARNARGRRDGSVLALLEEIGVAPLPELAWRELDPNGESLQSVERLEDAAGPAALPARGWSARWARPGAGDAPRAAADTTRGGGIR